MMDLLSFAIFGRLKYDTENCQDTSVILRMLKQIKTLDDAASTEANVTTAQEDILEDLLEGDDDVVEVDDEVGDDEDAADAADDEDDKDAADAGKVDKNEASNEGEVNASLDHNDYETNDKVDINQENGAIDHTTDHTTHMASPNRDVQLEDMLRGKDEEIATLRNMCSSQREDIIQLQRQQDRIIPSTHIYFAIPKRADEDKNTKQRYSSTPGIIPLGKPDFKGGTSHVHCAKLGLNDVVVKHAKHTGYERKYTFNEFRTLIHLSKYGNSSSVVYFHGLTMFVIGDETTCPTFGIVMDRCTGDIRSIFGMTMQQMGFYKRMAAIMCIMLGLIALREADIVHGDLKSSNVLFTKNKYYIADFSHSHISSQSSGGYLKQGDENGNYMPINEYRTKEADVYSFGWIVYMIFTTSGNEVNILQSIRDKLLGVEQYGEKYFELLDDALDRDWVDVRKGNPKTMEMRSFVKRCLGPPEQRPNIQDKRWRDLFDPDNISSKSPYRAKHCTATARSNDRTGGGGNSQRDIATRSQDGVGRRDKRAISPNRAYGGSYNKRARSYDRGGSSSWMPADDANIRYNKRERAHDERARPPNQSGDNRISHRSG